MESVKSLNLRRYDMEEIQAVMMMDCPSCSNSIKMEEGIMVCDCGFAPPHGAD